MKPIVKELLPLFPVKNYCDGGTDWCLDVRFTANCFAACSFCIASEDMKTKRDFDPEAMLEVVKNNKKISGLSIIGGEPLLFLDRLYNFMTSVRKEAQHIENMYITTALPPLILRKREIFDKIMNETAILNVSIQHYKPVENNLILQTKDSVNRIVMLEQILQTEGYPEKTRVHLNLAKGGIDTAEKLHAALYTLREIGVQEIKVNELMNAPDEYVNFEELTGENLDSPYANGCSTSLDNFFPGLKINLKRSCFIVEESRPASRRDLLKLAWKQEAGWMGKKEGVERVLYEDGMVTDRWQGDPL